MAFKFVIISCLVAVAAAGALPAVVEPVVAAPVAVAEPRDTSSYRFGWEVFDSITGDKKGQYETRDGSVVTGRYFLYEPDNTIRTVEYYADDVSGFNARVTHEPQVAPVVAEPVVEPVAARVVAGPAPVAPAVASTPVAVAPAFSPFSAAFTATAPLARLAPYTYPRFAQFRAPVVAV